MSREVTSAEAAKELRKLNEQLDELKQNESRASVFNAAMGEDPEAVRPEYDYGKTQVRLGEIEEKIRVLKHSINAFNVTTTVPNFTVRGREITIDQMLVLIPQLTAEKKRLERMASRLPKQRSQTIGYGAKPAIIDYEYANYDIEAVKHDLEKCSDELAKAQTALDLTNNTKNFAIDI